MGCGASKDAGSQPAAYEPPAKPFFPVSEPEFTPETKSRPPTETQDTAKQIELARRGDEISKSFVSGFESDGVDTKTAMLAETEPIQIMPVQTVTVAVLPPPPVTPPAAAMKPMFLKTDDTANSFMNPTAESEDTSYFPEQVPLAVGGGGGFRQQQQPSHTSLQEFEPLPSEQGPDPELDPAPAAAAAAAPAVTPASSTVPMFLPTASSRQLQPLPSLQQQQQRGQKQQLQSFQSQRSARLPPLQSQPQPLTESGPGPSSSGAAAGGGCADDPWSSLQSTYRIRDTQAVTGKSESARSRTTGSRDAGREMLVLGEDDDDFGIRSSGAGLNATANSALNRSTGYGTGRSQISLPPPQYGAAPKKGGWGSGAMARAGELMIGEDDDWLVSDRPLGAGGPPGAGYGRMQPPSQQQGVAVMSYNSKAKMVAADEDRHAPVTLKKGPAPPKGKEEEVLCEDVDDLDTLLEDEMERQGLSNKSLASKLAAYEAKCREEDDD